MNRHDALGLPHRQPFIFVDQLSRLEPGVSASGRKLVTMNEGMLQGHFPDQPVFPGTLLLESMAQLAGIAWLGETPGASAMLAAVNSARLLRPVVPGDVVDLEARVTRVLGRTARCQTNARVAGVEVGRAEFTLSRAEP